MEWLSSDGSFIPDASGNGSIRVDWFHGLAERNQGVYFEVS